MKDLFPLQVTNYFLKVKNTDKKALSLSILFRYLNKDNYIPKLIDCLKICYQTFFLRSDLQKMLIP